MLESNELNVVVVRTPLGRTLHVASDASGIAVSCWASGRIRTKPRRRDPVLAEAVEQLRLYFAGRLRCFDVPLSLVGTPFELAVWRAVAQLHTATLCSYADVARAVGRPSAYRGVARALGRAPLALFIPAHRVVGSDGRVKGAAVGSMRRRLIAFERDGAARAQTVRR